MCRCIFPRTGVGGRAQKMCIFSLREKGVKETNKKEKKETYVPKKSNTTMSGFKVRWMYVDPETLETVIYQLKGVTKNNFYINLYFGDRISPCGPG